MIKTISLLVLLSISMVELHAQIQHNFYGGYTYSNLKKFSKTSKEIPDRSTSFHVTKDYLGASGANAGYDFLFRFRDIFFASIGANVGLYRSSMDYNIVRPAAPCIACSSYTKTERAGINTNFKNINIRLPVSISFPITLKGNTFIKLGGDLMWNIANFSKWDFFEFNTLYTLVGENLWTTRIIDSSVESIKMEVNPFEQGLLIGLWKIIPVARHFFLIEANFRLPLNQLNSQTEVKQFNYALNIGYMLGSKIH